MHVFVGVVAGFILIGTIGIKQYIKNVNQTRYYKHTVKLLTPPIKKDDDETNS